MRATHRLALLLTALIMMPRPVDARQLFDPFGAARIDERPGARIPLEARFTDSRGTAVTLGGLARHRPILLVPVLHNCPNICGVTLSGIADAIAGQDKRPGRDFVLVAFGIDPEEKPSDAAGDLERLHDHAPKLKTDAVYALTGSKAAIRSVTDALGYHYAYDPRIGQYAHASAVAVISPQGRLTNWLYGLTPQPVKLSQALDDADAGVQPNWGEQLLLVCFHYDPETGRYTASIEKVLRLAGFGTVAGVGLLVWRLRRRAG